METMQKNPTAQRSGFISCRASTNERALAEQLQNKLQLGSQSELVRYLLNSQAKALGIS